MGFHVEVLHCENADEFEMCPILETSFKMEVLLKWMAYSNSVILSNLHVFFCFLHIYKDLLKACAIDQRDSN